VKEDGPKKMVGTLSFQSSFNKKTTHRRRYLLLWAYSNFFMKIITLSIFLIYCTGTSHALDSLSYIFTKVKIDGYDYKFLIDNGAEKTIIFKGRIKEKYPLRPVKLYGINHDTITFFVTTERLTLDLVDVGVRHKLYLGILDTLSNPVYELGFDGIIGNDILSKHDWKIDFANKKITVVNKKRLNKKEFRVMDFDERNHVPVTIENQRSNSINTMVEIDLGCHCYIDVWDSLRISSDSITRISRSYSVSTAKENQSHIETAKISFDQFDIHGFPVDFKLQRRYNLMGVKFFALYGEVYLIYSDRKLYLPKVKSRQVKINKLGIFNGVVESYIFIKGMPKPEWNLGQIVPENFSPKDEDYIYFDILIED